MGEEGTVAILEGGATAAVVVVLGLSVGDERGGVLVALHWRRSGSSPHRGGVPELRHGSFRTVSHVSFEVLLASGLLNVEWGKAKADVAYFIFRGNWSNVA